MPSVILDIPLMHQRRAVGVVTEETRCVEGWVGIHADAIGAGHAPRRLGIIERIRIDAPMIWTIAFAARLQSRRPMSGNRFHAATAGARV